MPLEKESLNNFLPNGFETLNQEGYKENFNEDKIATGFERDVPDIVSGPNFNNLLDVLGKNTNVLTKFMDFIKNMPINNLFTVDENNQLVYKNIDEVGGSGLEVGDISMALYVDETKWLRRYLNGQIVENNKNTKVFIEDYLLGLYATNPDYFTTEDNWQAEALLNIDGCVYKFVLNYADDGETVISVRLPKYPDYVEVNTINGTAPVSVYGNGMTLGLTNGTNNYGLRNKAGSGGNNLGFYPTLSDYGKQVGLTATDITFDNLLFGITRDPKKSGIVGSAKLSTSQTKLKLRYFIQIATGSETENNIVNDIELNNPYSLFDYKYSPFELNNISWLKSNGQWNAKAVYPNAYDKLLKVCNGTETVEGLSVKLSTEAYTNYDFVLNTSDETFRLPIDNFLSSTRYLLEKGTQNGISYRVYSDGYCEQSFIIPNNGTTSGKLITLLKRFKDINYNILLSSIRTAYNANGDAYKIVSNNTFNVYQGSGGDMYCKASGYLADGEYTSQNLYLYYYVGETVQNANLIDAGRIAEVKADRSELDGNWIYLNKTLLSNITITSEQVKDVDISSILPNDGNLYELIITADYSIPSGAGKQGALSVYSDVWTYTLAGWLGRSINTASGINGATAGQCMMLVGASRILHFRQNATNDIISIYARIVAYRKVR